MEKVSIIETSRASPASLVGFSKLTFKRTHLPLGAPAPSATYTPHRSSTKRALNYCDFLYLYKNLSRQSLRTIAFASVHKPYFLSFKKGKFSYVRGSGDRPGLNSALSFTMQMAFGTDMEFFEIEFYHGKKQNLQENS